MAYAIASTQINALFKKKAPTPPPAPAKKGFSLPSFPGSKKAAAPPPKSKESSGFKLPSFGTKASPAPTKKAAAPKKAGFSLPSLPGKKAPATKKGGFGTKNGGKAKVRRSANDGPLGLFQGNFGANRTLWNGFASNPEAPAYLDGTLPGDAGFDPFGLSKPVEYLQFDLDSLDQNSAISPSGNVIGKLKRVDNKSGEQTLVVSAPIAMRGKPLSHSVQSARNIERHVETPRNAYVARHTPAVAAGAASWNAREFWAVDAGSLADDTRTWWYSNLRVRWRRGCRRERILPARFARRFFSFNSRCNTFSRKSHSFACLRILSGLAPSGPSERASTIASRPNDVPDFALVSPPASLSIAALPLKRAERCGAHRNF